MTAAARSRVRTRRLPSSRRVGAAAGDGAHAPCCALDPQASRSYAFHGVPMRFVIPAVLLLSSSAAVAAHAQTVPAPESTAPAPVTVDTQTTRAAAPVVGQA